MAKTRITDWGIAVLTVALTALLLGVCWFVGQELKEDRLQSEQTSVIHS